MTMSGTAGRALLGASEPRRPTWVLPRAGPRASERGIGGLGVLCLKVFLVAQFFSLTRVFFLEHFGWGLSSYFSQAGLLTVPLLFPAAVSYGLREGGMFGTLVPRARLWSFMVMGHAVLLFSWGWLVKGYDVTVASKEMAPYLVVIAFTILGSIPRVWKDMDRLVLVLFVAALAVNAMGMTEMTSVVSETDAEAREARSVVAYRTQWALAFCPLLLFTARQRRPRIALLIFAGAFFALAQQILFQKRSPTVRVLLYMVVFLVVLPWLRPRKLASSGEARTQTMFAAVFALGVFVSLAAAPWLFRGQLAGLARRLSGESYSEGATGMLIFQNERFAEAAMFFRSLGPEEIIFGRGFGGYFVPDEPGWGLYQDDVHAVVSRGLHVGGLLPFFKGGLLFAFLYYLGYALALLRGRRALSEPLTAAAWFVVGLHALFLIQESWFIMSNSFDLVVVGLCLGHLLSRERDLPGASPPRLHPWVVRSRA
jgi:hypothetical protein